MNHPCFTHDFISLIYSILEAYLSGGKFGCTNHISYLSIQFNWMKFDHSKLIVELCRSVLSNHKGYVYEANIVFKYRHGTVAVANSVNISAIRAGGD